MKTNEEATLKDLEDTVSANKHLTFDEYAALKAPAIDAIVNDFAVKLVERATPILGHIAANLAAVIRQETGWLDFSYEPTVAGIGFTVLMLLIAVALIWYQILLYKRENLED